MQRHPVAEVADPLERLGTRAADHAVDLVTLFEQELGEVGAILASNASNEGGACHRCFHGVWSGKRTV